MCSAVEDGGLEMISVKSQQKVFLLKWLEIVANKNSTNHYTAGLGRLIFKPVGGVNYFLSASIDNKELRGTKSINHFWKQVLKTWLEVKKSTREIKFREITEILAEPIFNNEMIQYKNKSIFFPTWIEKGITNLVHICNRNGIKPINEIESIVGKSPQLLFDYNTVINAIPKEWKTLIYRKRNDIHLLENRVNLDATKEEALQLLGRKNKMLRNLFKGSSQICSIAFWKRKLMTDISPYFVIAKNSSKESRLRLLHLKILHNIWPTNILLSKMKIKETNKCDYCQDTDFIEHFFYNCKKLQGFWEHVAKTIEGEIGININLSVVNVLFGILLKDIEGITRNDLKYVNEVILIAKMCISKLRYGPLDNIFIIFEMEMTLRSPLNQGR